MKPAVSSPKIGRLPHLTIADIAQRAQVSNATVSRVFNEEKYVAQKTREKVLRALHELEAEFDLQKRQEVSSTKGPEADQRSGYMLISFTSVTMCYNQDPFIIDGIVEAVHERGARPVICPLAHRHNTDLTLMQRLMAGEAKGGLVIGPTDDMRELYAAYRGGFPLVLIDPEAVLFDGLPIVTIAHWHNARIATEHLLALGHRRIAMISEQPSSHMSTTRLAGYQAALLAAQLPIDQVLVQPVDELSSVAGYQAACAIFDLPERPTAIIACTDSQAAGIVQAAHERGIRVPDDLSVMGCGDLPFAQMLVPQLTSVSLPYEEMGRVAVDMLFRIITRQIFEGTRIELVGRLASRGSTAPYEST